jgi:hypothetical protein
MADQRSASRDRARLIRLRSYSIAKERRRDQPRLGERLAQVRAYLLVQIEVGHDMPTDEEQLKQVNWLMVLSHLEIVNALGALEERMASAQYRRRRRWF